MSDSNNGLGKMIEETINFGREDRSSKYKKIKMDDSRYKNFSQCSHVMIYARTNAVAIDSFPVQAVILMHMRFDGYIGFPGGFVDKGETPVQAACREVKEEVGWSEENGAISETDYQFSYVDENLETVMHFYATEVTELKMKEIEQNMVKASNYGTEVLGHFRIPLYIMGDAFRGFPAFLRNHFKDCAKLQLIETLINLKFFTEEQIIQALHTPPLLTY